MKKITALLLLAAVAGSSFAQEEIQPVEDTTEVEVVAQVDEQVKVKEEASIEKVQEVKETA